MPFGGFEDWDDCIQTMTTEEGHDQESAENICGALQAEAKADHGDPEALMQALERGRGLIADVGVDLVSGVDVPAIDSKWVMLKSEDDAHDYRVTSPILLSKADGDEEKRISYAAAMIPREPDKEGDVAPTATVERAAHDFLKSDGGIDTDHSLIDGEGTPVESWVLKEERTFDLPGGSEETYPAGTWMLGVEWGADAWQRIKDGELTGLSIYGMAEHVPLERAATCCECGGELTAAKSANGDNGKRDDSDSGDMGEQTAGDGETSTDDTSGGDGPDIAEVAASVEALSETVASVKDAVETTKQDPQEAAAMLGEEFDMTDGDVMELLAAADEMGVESVLQAIDSMDTGGEEVANETDMDEEEEEKAADDVEKRTDEANMAKGHTGEGVREATAKQRDGDAGGTSGMPSYAAAAEEGGQ